MNTFDIIYHSFNILDNYIYIFSFIISLYTLVRLRRRFRRNPRKLILSFILSGIISLFSMYIIKRLLLKYISENKDLLPPGVIIPGINIINPIDVVAAPGRCVCNQSSGDDCVVSGDLEIKMQVMGQIPKRYCNNPDDDNYEECPSSHPHEIEITEADAEWDQLGFLSRGGCDCEGLFNRDGPCKICARFKDVRVPNMCSTENARCIGTATDTSKTCDLDASTGDCPEGCSRTGMRETCQGDGSDSIGGRWGTPSTLYYLTPNYGYKGRKLESRTDISPAIIRGMETYFYDRKPMCKWNPQR